MWVITVLSTVRPASVVHRRAVRDLTVLSTVRPASVVLPAEAAVEVRGAPAPARYVVEAGLAALHESKASLFGYGVRGHGPDEDLPPGTYVVYANRD